MFTHAKQLAVVLGAVALIIPARGMKTAGGGADADISPVKEGCEKCNFTKVLVSSDSKNWVPSDSKRGSADIALNGSDQSDTNQMIKKFERTKTMSLSVETEKEEVQEGVWEFRMKCECQNDKTFLQKHKNTFFGALALLGMGGGIANALVSTKYAFKDAKDPSDTNSSADMGHLNCAVFGVAVFFVAAIFLISILFRGHKGQIWGIGLGVALSSGLAIAGIFGIRGMEDAVENYGDALTFKTGDATMLLSFAWVVMAIVVIGAVICALRNCTKPGQ